MRRFGILLFLVAIALSARAEDWTTADGKTYKNVVVVGQEPDGVRITYTGGIGKIPYYELSDDILKRFGQDAATLAVKKQAAEKAAADAALKAQQDAAELKKEQDEAAAAQGMNPSAQPGAPGNPAAPGAPGTPGSPGAPGTAVAPSPHPAVNPATATAVTPAPVAPIVPVAPTEENPYPNSKFQYDEGQDTSYLDSISVTLIPVSQDASPTAPPPPGQGATLVMRVQTEGRHAEAPDVVIGLFGSPTPLKKLGTDNKVKFLADGAFIQGTPVVPEGDVVPDPSLLLTQVVFSLTPIQAEAIIRAKNLNMSVGNYDFRIDENGIAAFRAYLTDVNRLPPPSTDFVRAYHRFMNRLPSLVAMISTTCEYIILGAFALVMVASIAAFIMGLTRFIKM